MTKQSFRKQRGGSGAGDDDMMSTPGGDSFSGSSIKGGRKHSFRRIQ